MKRKIYQQLLDWKEKRNGEVALLIEGARRIGKSYIVEEFAKNYTLSSALYDTLIVSTESVSVSYTCISKLQSYAESVPSGEG